MKKIFHFTCVIMMFGLQLVAQPKIEKSEIFSEPLSEGWTKLLLLKNGNTFYFHYGGKKGIEVTVFDKNKKNIGTQVFKSDNWSAKKKRLVEICGLYEINGEPVIFLEYFGDITPVLYRIRLSAADGSLVKEERIGEDHKKRFLLQHSMIIGDNNIYVEKDPASDNYAIVFFKAYEKNVDKKIELMYFNGNHQMLSHAWYNSPQSDFKFLTYIGAVVDGNKRAFIMTYGAKTEKGKEAHVFVARLNAGDSTFLNKTLDFTEDFMQTKSDVAYDHKNNRLVMLTNTVAEKKKSMTSYASFISYIDPENLSLKGVNIVGTEKVNTYTQKSFGKDIEFHGVPQRLVLNKDYSITVLQEELNTEDVYSAKSGGKLAEYTYMGNIGITDLDADGSEKDGYAMMKKQFYVGKLNSMYMVDRDKGKWTNNIYSKRNTDDNLFMSFEYVHGNNGDYVLFNDNPKNDKKDEDQKKRKTTSNTDYINTICYSLKNGEAKRTYLFGEPEGKNNTRACYIEASEYDKSTNTYVTVVSEQHGWKYESRIAWIHFD